MNIQGFKSHSKLDPSVNFCKFSVPKFKGMSVQNFFSLMLLNWMVFPCELVNSFFNNFQWHLCFKLQYSAHSVIGSRLIESAAYCNQILLVVLYLSSTQKTINFIVRLMLSLLCWPKLILLSGGHWINISKYLVGSFCLKCSLLWFCRCGLFLIGDLFRSILFSTILFVSSWGLTILSW